MLENELLISKCNQSSLSSMRHLNASNHFTSCRYPKRFNSGPQPNSEGQYKSLDSTFTKFVRNLENSKKLGISHTLGPQIFSTCTVGPLILDLPSVKIHTRVIGKHQNQNKATQIRGPKRLLLFDLNIYWKLIKIIWPLP